MINNNPSKTGTTFSKKKIITPIKFHCFGKGHLHCAKITIFS